MTEIIYVLTNKAMLGYVKIGNTTTSLVRRVAELSRLADPVPANIKRVGVMVWFEYG